MTMVRRPIALALAIAIGIVIHPMTLLALPLPLPFVQKSIDPMTHWFEKMSLVRKIIDPKTHCHWSEVKEPLL